MNELSLALAIGSCVGVGALGSVATRRGLNGWYEALSKPAWNPPRWIFAPVWTLLYVMMGVAAWLCWKEVGLGYGYWFFTFSLQLLLNLAWSFIFFSLKNLLLAFIEVTALWVWIVVTIAVFSRISPLAAWLMVPYLTWVTFASVLNFTIYRLNRGQPKTLRNRQM